MYYIESRGSWFEIGRDHGSKLSDQIKKTYVEFDYQRLTDPQYEPYLRRLQQYANEHHPEIMEEIRGIADGSGITANEAFLLSGGETILGCVNEDLFKTACTVMAVRGEKGGGAVGKTHDITPLYQRCQLVQKIVPTSGMAMIRAGQVGSVWTVAGVNEAGLSTGLASGQHFPGQSGHGLLQHCSATPTLASCSTTAEAEFLLDDMVLAGTGVNLAFADTLGDIAIVEKSFDRQSVRRNPAGPVFGAQHFWADCMQGYLPPPESRNRNSRGRCATLEKLLAPGTFANPVAKLAEVLSYKEGPAPICQDQDGFLTLSAYLADSATRRLYAWPNPPTPDSFVCFGL